MPQRVRDGKNCRNVAASATTALAPTVRKRPGRSPRGITLARELPNRAVLLVIVRLHESASPQTMTTPGLLARRAGSCCSCSERCSAFMRST
jgi:hypothetical protein